MADATTPAAASPRDDDGAAALLTTGDAESPAAKTGADGDDAAAAPAAAGGEPTKTVKNIRVAAQTTKKLSTGYWLPMAQDKLRNNVRLRPLLVGIYTMIMMIVIVLIVLALYEPKDDSITMRFSVPPPRIIALGAKNLAWSVQIVDGDGNGLGGVPVSISITALKPIPLTTTLDGELYETRSVNCLESNLRGRTPSAYTDFPLCSPHNFELLTPSTVLTDGTGRATFTNMTLMHGAKNDYNLVVFAESARFTRGFSYLRTFLTVIDSQATADVTGIDGINEEIRINEPITVNATVTWAGTLDSFGSAVAVIMPMDLSRPAVFKAPKVAPFTLYGPENRGIWPTMNIGVVSPPEQVDPFTLRANVSVRCVISGSNSPVTHLGLFFFGTFVPLMPRGLDDPMMAPRILLPPLFVRSDHVASVAAVATPPSGFEQTVANTLVIIENNDVQLTVTVRDAAGNPVAGKQIFSYIVPDAVGNPTRSGSTAMTHPSWNPKTLFSAIASVPTDANGVAVFTVRPTALGGIGRYWLFVRVDGVAATWANYTKPDRADDACLPLVIATAAARLSYRLTAAPWTSATAEIVGQPWQRLPTVRVLDANGQPIPGKIAELFVDGAGQNVVAPAVESDGEGWATFQFVTMTSTRLFGTVTFVACVDLASICTRFNRTIQPPYTVASRDLVAPVVPNGTCAALDFITQLQVVYTGLSYDIAVQVFDLYGNPAPNQQVILVLYPGLIPNLANFPVAITNASGIAVIKTLPLGGVGPAGFPLASRLLCLGLETSNSMVIRRLVTNIVSPIVSRVYPNIDTTPLPNGDVRVELGIDFDHVSPSRPLSLFPVPLWRPVAAAQFYPESTAVGASELRVTEPQTPGSSRVVLTATFPFVVPGTTYMALTADGEFITGVIFFGRPEVSSLTLEQSALAGLPFVGYADDSTRIVSATVGETFPQRPRVRTHGSDFGVVFPVFGTVTFPANGSRHVDWLEPFANVTNASVILVVGYSQSYNDIVTNAANATGGIAQLPLQYLTGGDTSRVYAVRYCYINDLRLSFVQNTSHTRQSVCVEEDAYFIIPESDQPVVSISPTSVLAIPGQPIPAVTVTAGYTSNKPMRFMFTSATCAESNAFVFSEQWSQLPGAPNGLLIMGNTTTGLRARESVVFNDWTFATTADEGTFTVRIFVAGASVDLAVVVSTEVASIDLQVPVDKVTVGSAYVITATAKGKNRQDMPGKLLEIVLRRDRNPIAEQFTDKPCDSTASCGQLGAGSVTYGSTDGIGELVIPLTLDTAATGGFRAVVRQADGALSDATLAQLVRSDVRKLTALLGVPKTSLVSTISTLNPSAIEVIVILLDLETNTNDVTTDDEDEGDNGLTDDVELGTKQEEYDEVFATKRQSDVSKQLQSVKDRFFPPPEAQTAKATTDLFQAWNEVSSIVIERQPNLHVSVTAKSESFETLVGDSNYEGAFDGGSAPVISVYGHDGMPLPEQEVTVTTIPNTGLELGTSTFVTDRNGRLTLAGLSLRYVNAGVYKLHFSSRGSRGNTTQVNTIVVSFVQMSIQETMKEYVWFVVLSFAPMFLASVPHTRFIYTALGGVFSITVFVLIVVYIDMTWSDLANTFFAQAYFGSLIGLAALLMVMQLGVLFIDFMARVRRNPKFNFINDETRALHVFRYAQWITNARIEAQIVEDAAEARRKNAEGPKGVDKVKATMATKVDGAKRSVTDKVDKLDETLQLELLDKTEDERRKAGLRRAYTERPPLRTPKEIVPAFVPLNLQLVFGIIIVLTFMNTLFVTYLYLLLRNKLGEFLNYIPNVPNPALVDKANRILVEGISDALLIIGQVTPEFAFLSEVAVPLRQINLLAFLQMLRNILQAVMDKALAAFVIGCIAGIGAVMFNVIWMTLTAPAQVLKVRRRELTAQAYGTPAVAKIEPYVGLHSLHFFVMFHMIFWPTVIITFVMLIEDARDFVIDKAFVAIVASLSSLAITLALRFLLVNMFFIDGWTVIRPQMYAMYSFMDLVLGVFSGIIGTIVRYVQAIAFMSLCFAKLDESVFPALFQATDMAFKGYASMIASEARNSSPIMLFFSTYLMTTVRLRELQRRQQDEDSGKGALKTGTAVTDEPLGGDDGAAQPVPLNADGKEEFSVRVDVSRFGCEDSDEPYQSAMVINLARMLLRHNVGAGVDLTKHVGESPESDVVAVPLPSLRRTRLINRWRLAVILYFNPSIRRLRKQRLWVKDEGEGDLISGPRGDGVFGGVEKGTDAGVAAAGKFMVM